MLHSHPFKKTLSLCISAALVTPVCLRADLRYEETTEMKGGIMESLGKFAGMFGAKGLTKSTTSTSLKGDRMRKDQLDGVELTSSQIIQLDREQIVTLDHKKKTYTVMTFAEMRAQMEKAIAAAKSTPPPQKQPAPDADTKPDVKVEPKINVKDTGETKVINGFNTRRVLLTVEMEGEDQKTKDKGAMGADTELWITKEVSGFDEQNQFYMKYAKAMASPELVKSMGGSPGMGQDPRVAESAQAMRKKMESLEGLAILTIMSFNVSGTPSEETKNQKTQTNSTQKKSNEDRPPENMTESIGKALGGFGGFGGFGKKKKKEEPTTQRAETSPATTTSADGKVSATLMTSTTELKSFSNTALDASLFDIPAGYKLKQKD
jgi:hypothetical protein